MKHISFFCFVFLSCFASSIFSQVERIDSSSGSNGRTIVNIGSTEDNAVSTVIQSDGKIVIAGNAVTNNVNTALMIRYNTDGTFDTTFGYKGYVVPFSTSERHTYAALTRISDDKLLVGGWTLGEKGYRLYVAKYSAEGAMEGLVRDTISTDTTAMATDIAVQEDGKILVSAVALGGVNYNFALFRYTPSLQPDLTFGYKGKIVTSFATYDNIARSVLIQKDGKIILAGHTRLSDISRATLVRYHEDGVIDKSFGTNGIASFYIRGTECGGTYAALDSSGNILLSGFAEYSPSKMSMAVVRLKPNGEFDPTFNDSGKVVFAIGSKEDYPYKIKIQRDGKAVVTGYSKFDNQTLMSAIRLTTDGTFDSTFNNDGIITISVGMKDDQGHGLDIDSTGRIVLTGYALLNGRKDIATICLDSNGTFDPSFSGDGQVTTNYMSFADAGKKLLYSPSRERFIIAGSSQGNGASDYSAAAFTPTGAIDNAFGVSGLTTGAAIYPQNYCYAAALQKSGALLVAGATLDNQSPQKLGMTMIRFNRDGKRDLTFGGQGYVYTYIEDANQQANAIAIQPDSKILLAGDIQIGVNTKYLVARYDSNGRVDETFADGVGYITNSLSAIKTFANGILLEQDGKIIIVGRTSNDNLSFNMYIARLLTGGVPDYTYGNSSKTIINTGSNANVSAVIRQPDGKIVIGGNTDGVGGKDIVLARVTTNGIVDSTFGTNGLVILKADSSTEFCNSIVMRPSGRMIVIGHTVKNTISDCLLSFITEDGKVDTRFGVNGQSVIDMGSSSEYFSDAMVDNNLLVVAGSVSMPESSMDLMITRVFLSNDLGVLTMGEEPNNVCVFPNPLQSTTTVTYSLTKPEHLSIMLMDMSGRYVQSFVTDEFRSVGDHTEKLVMGDALPAGAYMLIFSNGKDSQPVKVIKQ